MQVTSHIDSNSQHLIASREESYTLTAKKYLDHIISIIASYAPLITFWTTLLYTTPEIEAYAIMSDSPIISTTPEPDQIDIRPVLSGVEPPCYYQSGPIATDLQICHQQTNNDNPCIIL